MSLTFKLLSLVIRTAAKPIGNYIKRQAKDHEGFRRFAIARAQAVHRIDMRMRLGILHDAEAQQRMHERETKLAEERKREKEKEGQVPTVRTEEEQRVRDEMSEEKKAEEDATVAAAGKRPKVKIRPLSEAKAIELGANFFSEAFIFAVAAGLLVWDSWRNRRKESQRRDDVAERLEALEGELEALRKAQGVVVIEDEGEWKERVRQRNWWDPAGWWERSAGTGEGEGKVGDGDAPIPGTVPGGTMVKVVKAAEAGEKEVVAVPSGGKDSKAVVKDSKPVVKDSKPRVEDVKPPRPPERVDSVTAPTKER